MGDSFHCLSLRLAAALTLVWRGVRVSPPPIRRQLLLPLLLAVLGGLGEPPRAGADSVRLKSQGYSWTHTERNQFDSSSGTEVHEHDNKDIYTFVWGGTYTNYSFQNQTYTTSYGTNDPGTGPRFRFFNTTNRASAPWEGTTVGTGTRLEDYRNLEHNYVNSVLVSNAVNILTNYTHTNYQGYWDDDEKWPMGDWTYSATNSSGTSSFWEHNIYSVTSVAELLTSGTNGSALFCLTGSVDDLSSGSGVPIATGWKLAGTAADASGRVFKIFDNGTSNNVSASLGDSLTNSVTNWQYNVTPARVPLGIQWKSSSTNDTNWQSGPLFVLKGTTVLFKVTTPGFTGVVWPTNTMPAWSNGSNGVEQITMTFDTVSSTTNGQWVEVTAGTTASNRVVVFDYEVKFKPVGVGIFTGRPEYTTTFGVGEEVDFVAKFDPAGISPDVGWTASGMSTGAPDADRCVYYASDSTLQAGAFTETITVEGILIDDGPSFGMKRTNQFTVIKPSNAILKDVLPFTATNGTFLFASTNIGHMTNQWSCTKKASYFLLPQNVSFHGIQIGEGTGPYRYSGGYFNNTNAPQGVAGLTNDYIIVVGGVTNIFTFEYPAMADHTPATKNPASHFTNYPSLSFEPNYFISDQFGGNYGPGAVDVPHTPFLLTTLTGTIQIEYTRATTNTYSVTNVISKREFWSNGKLVIEKASSGPHSKEYTDPTSPD